MSASPMLRLIADRLLAMVRIVAVVATLLMIMAFLASIVLAPGYIASTNQVNSPNITWTVESTLAALAQLGMSPQGYSWLAFLFEVVVGLIYAAMASVLLLRVHDNWIGLYVAFTLGSFIITGSIVADVLLYHLPWLSGAVLLLGQYGWQLQFILFLFFPDGRFVPRWTRWLLIVWIIASFVSIEGNAAIIFGLVMVMTSLGSQVFRFLRRADAVQRQQTKWVLFAICVILVLTPAFILPFIMPAPFSQNGGTSMVLTLISKYSAQLTFALFPICLGIAILRYRLWDVDVFIRRTVVYGLLTAFLVLVYYGSVIILQQIIVVISGQRNELAIILSTLIVAVLVAPLRSRIQAVIDRRLYRRKYDAEKTLAQFNQTLRDEVNLDELRQALIGVVDGTMQPARLALWVRENPHKEAK